MKDLTGGEGIPSDSCILPTLTSAQKWTDVLSIPCNSWIFFTRVRAVYPDSHLVKWMFFALWCTTFAIFVTPFTTEIASTPLQNGKCLTITSPREYQRVASIVSMVPLTIFDTAVMVAVSIRMVSYSLSDSWRPKMYCLIFGNEMGNTSRLFLRSSQTYYL